MEQQYDRVATPALPVPIALPGVLPLVAIALALIGAVILVQLSGVTATGYDLRRLKTERSDWQRENQLLESYVANLQSLERVERVATDKLKMVPAKDRVYLTTARRPQAHPVPAELPPRPESAAAAAAAETTQLRLARWIANWLAVKPPEQAQQLVR